MSAEEREREERRILELGPDSEVKTYLELLLRILSIRHADTVAHSQRVASLAVDVAAQLDLDAEEQDRIRQASLLHDIGKIGIPDRILLKPDELAPEELELVRQHLFFADYILQVVPPLAPLYDVIHRIYEAWDGSGYPDGLAGEEIPLASRIIAVADSFDAITREHPYRPALPDAAALFMLRRGAGSRWDPHVVQVLEELLEPTIELYEPAEDEEDSADLFLDS